MNAVLYRLRSVIRDRWAGTLALTLVVALVCGVVIASGSTALAPCFPCGTPTSQPRVCLAT